MRRDFNFLASTSASLMSQMSGITAASESAQTVLRPYKVLLSELPVRKEVRCDGGSSARLLQALLPLIRGVVRGAGAQIAR